MRRCACAAAGALRRRGRAVASSGDPAQGATMFSAHPKSFTEDVRAIVEAHGSPQVRKLDPDCVGALLGHDPAQEGIAGELEHMEGFEQEEKRRRKLDNVISSLFPAGAPPPPNAMAVALAPTPEELEQREENESLKEAVRERYRRSVERRQAERRRTEDARRLAEAALAGAPGPTPAAPPSPAPAAAAASAQTPPAASCAAPAAPRAVPAAAAAAAPPAPPRLRQGASEAERLLHTVRTDAARSSAELSQELLLLRLKVTALEVEELSVQAAAKQKELIAIADELRALGAAPPPVPPAPEPARDAAGKLPLREQLAVTKLAQERELHVTQKWGLERDVLRLRLRVVEQEVANLSLRLGLKKEEEAAAVRAICGS
eukprot:TRINITY_DN21106_c0_g2_i1.p2 TRINITY_DN21106_c0_g2~~TRINITY_DN21106_c0_g2_i1.p2  ORF type:complete len:402 (+),score=161.47 TRINITY_DN21106_c0_g2_i1:84-1208(+)